MRRVRNDQLATLKQHGGRRRRPSGLWSICVSGDRCGDAVGFSLSKGGNATDAGKRKGIGRKSRGNSCQRKHPAEILALGPSCASRLPAGSFCRSNGHQNRSLKQPANTPARRLRHYGGSRWSRKSPDTMRARLILHS